MLFSKVVQEIQRVELRSPSPVEARQQIDLGKNIPFSARAFPFLIVVISVSALIHVQVILTTTPWELISAKSVATALGAIYVNVLICTII